MTDQHRATRRRTTAALGASLAAAVAAPAAAHAQGPADAVLVCGTVVSTDVRLRADLVKRPSSGLVVGAPGVTIDLDGHTIDGTGTGVGIDDAGFGGVRVVGGTVREFAFGIDLLDLHLGRVDRVSLAANGTGLIVERSVDVDISRVSAIGNAFDGIAVNVGDGVTVRRSTAAGNGVNGLVDLASVSTRFEHDVAADNGLNGILVHFFGQDVVVRHNVAVRNAGNGITIDVPGTIVAANRADANGGAGIAAVD